MPLPPLAGVLAAVVAFHAPDDSARTTGHRAPATVVLAPAPEPTAAPTPAPSPDRLVVPDPVATGSRYSYAADSLVVEKAAHRLTLYYRGAPVRTYLVALGNPVGDKERLGDRRTPLGVFHIDYRNPQSRFHLALHISYPDARHAARARASGVAPGGDLMIHGLPNGQGDVGADHRQDDWTNGCIAVTDEEIEEIWRAVPIGAPIEIKP
jgi:murein L,D-transpeptidase YafK